jgi:macrodomain Ter protein organizer (MatP/YcbG family)
MSQQIFESHERKQLLFRSSRRISITIPFSIAKQLEEKSDQEGRSLSNLASYLLEKSLSEIKVSSPL